MRNFTMLAMITFVFSCPLFSIEPLIVVATIDFECGESVEIGIGSEDIDCLFGYPIFENKPVSKVDEFECSIDVLGDGFCCSYEEIEWIPIGSVAVYPGVGMEPFCYSGDPPKIQVITFQSSKIFSDGFESGSAERWDRKSP